MRKRYKAIVIDGKIILRNLIIMTIAGFVLFLVIINVNLAGKNIFITPDEIAKSSLNEVLPVVSATSEGGSKRLVSQIKVEAIKCFNFVITFDPNDLSTIFFSEIPLTKVVNMGALSTLVFNPNAKIATLDENGENRVAPVREGTADSPVLEGDKKPIKTLDASQKSALGKNSSSKVLISNETSHSINIDDFLNSPLKINFKSKGPKVLIVHTHATESFSEDGSLLYDVNKSDRSANKEESIITVGRDMEKILNSAGVQTLHDETLHDYPSYNNSYSNSLATVEKYKKKYPSIQIVLDIHRDAIVYDDGTKVRVVANIDGEDTAQAMFVVGTNDGGLEHPEWKENLKFAVQLQDFICGKYPYLMRGINLRKERFNGHTTYGSLIIEIGTNGNSLEEARRGGTFVAKALAEFIKSTQ